MARFHNKKLAKEVGKLVEKGLSHSQIGIRMNKKYGDSMWPSQLTAAKNKATRYAKHYKDLYKTTVDN